MHFYRNVHSDDNDNDDDDDDNDDVHKHARQFSILVSFSLFLVYEIVR